MAVKSEISCCFFYLDSNLGSTLPSRFALMESPLQLIQIIMSKIINGTSWTRLSFLKMFPYVLLFLNQRDFFFLNMHFVFIQYENFNFSRVDFYLLVRRKSLFFITYTIFPCLALSTLQIFSHMLPFTEAERINFATTTLIAFSVFHVSIVEQMPQSSESVPLLAIYVDSLMILIGLSLIECFVMMNWLSKVAYTVPSPMAWYWVVERWGDWLSLGSAGKFWRRNYLKVYERVNSRTELLNEQRRLKKLLRHYRRPSDAARFVRENKDILLNRPSYGEGDRFFLEKLASRWNEPVNAFDALVEPTMAANTPISQRHRNYVKMSSEAALLDESIILPLFSRRKQTSQDNEEERIRLSPVFSQDQDSESPSVFSSAYSFPRPPSMGLKQVNEKLLDNFKASGWINF